MINVLVDLLQISERAASEFVGISLFGGTMFVQFDR
jgi:hypothetical protein